MARIFEWFFMMPSFPFIVEYRGGLILGGVTRPLLIAGGRPLMFAFATRGSTAAEAGGCDEDSLLGTTDGSY